MPCRTRVGGGAGGAGGINGEPYLSSTSLSDRVQQQHPVGFQLSSLLGDVSRKMDPRSSTSETIVGAGRRLLHDDC